METKKCKKCGIVKNLEGFHNLKSSKDGKRDVCKICVSRIQKLYIEKNRDKILLKKKEYRDSPNGKAIRKEYREKYYLKNKAIENKRSSIWNKLNKDAMKNYNKLYSKEYRKKYPHTRAWRMLLHNSLRRLGQDKEKATIELLGYSALDLKNHIASLFTDGMSWNNYGEWHIDHIKKVISFSKNTPQNIVNALSNLRPLWATTREINGVIYEGNLNREKY